MFPVERLGPYKIVERVGGGGMGDVYKACDASLDRTVALKVLPGELARHQEFVRRFYAEATAAAKIRHPHVVRIDFVGEDGGRHFFAMEFIEGESLAQRVAQRRRLPLGETLDIIEQCLNGLAAAHGQGLIHRDVKPANILIESGTNRAVLVDFGLVRRIDRTTRVTLSGVVLGTADYMAPEQARSRDVDHRADIYSLGIVFYQALAGRLPFSAETPVAMMFQHAYHQPRPLEQAAPEVPEPVCQIVSRMIAKRPAARYQDCAQVQEDLHAFRQGRPLAPVPPEAVEADAVVLSAPEPAEEPALSEGLARLASVRPWDRLRDLAATMFRRHAPVLLQELRGTTQQVDGAVAHYQRRRDRLLRLRDEAQGVLAALERQIQANIEVAEGAAQQVHSPATGEDRRRASAEKRECEEEVGALRQQHRRQQDELDRIELQLNKAEAAWVRLRSQRDVLQARLRAAEARPRPRPKPAWRGWLWGAAIASTLALFAATAWLIHSRPDRPEPPSRAVAREGQRIGRDGVAEPVALSPAGQLRLIQCPLGSVQSIAVSSDAKRVWAATAEGLLGVWESESGRPLQQTRLAAESKPVVFGHPRIAIAPDAGRIACAGPDSFVRLYDPESLEVITEAELPIGALAAVAFLPDGEDLLIGGGSYWTGSIQHPLGFFDMHGNRQGASLEVVGERISCAAVSPDGRFVLAGVDDDSLRLLDASDGREIRRLEGHDRRVASVRFLPDGRHALSGSWDTTVRLWDLKTGEELQRFEGHRDRVHDAAVSDDGAYGLSASGDRTVRLWDLQRGTEVCSLQGHTDVVRCVAFLPASTMAVSGSDDGTIRFWQLPIPER